MIRDKYTVGTMCRIFNVRPVGAYTNRWALTGSTNQKSKKLRTVEQEACGGLVVKALQYKTAGRGFDSRWCHWNFSVTYSFWSHYGPGVDSASNRNEYQVYFLGVKAALCVRLTTLPPSRAVVMKSGNLNFLEPSGPL